MNFDQFDKGAVMGVGLVVGSAFMTFLLCGKCCGPWMAVKGWLSDLFRRRNVKLGGKVYPLDNGQVKVDGISIPLILARAWAKVRPLEDFLPWKSELKFMASLGGGDYPYHETLPDDHYRFTEGQWNEIHKLTLRLGAPQDRQVDPPGVMCLGSNWWALGQYSDGSLLVEKCGDRETAFKKIDRVYGEMVAQRLWQVHHAGGLTRGVAGVAMQSSVVSGSTGGAVASNNAVVGPDGQFRPASTTVSLGAMPVVDDDLARQMGVAGMIPAGAAAGLIGVEVGVDWEAEAARLSNESVVAMRSGQPVITAQQGESSSMMLCEQWNERYPIGTRVAVNTMDYAVRGDGVTLTPAYVMREGSPAMVYVTEPANVQVGCPVPLRDVRPLEDIAREGRERAAALATPANPQVSVNMVADSQGLSQNLRRNRDGRSAIPGIGVIPESLAQTRAMAQAAEDQAVFAAIDAAGIPPPRVATPEELCVFFNRSHPVGSAVTYRHTMSLGGSVSIDGRVIEPALPIMINGEGMVPTIMVSVDGTTQVERIRTIEVQGISDRYTDSVTEWAWQYVVGGRQIGRGGMTREFAPTPNDVEKVALRQLVESGQLLYEEPVDHPEDHPLNASVEDARLQREFFETVDDVQSVVG